MLKETMDGANACSCQKIGSRTIIQLRNHQNGGIILPMFFSGLR
jgi:hypothetical protein